MKGEAFKRGCTHRRADRGERGILETPKTALTAPAMALVFVD